jgi:hypothetical protein
MTTAEFLTKHHETYFRFHSEFDPKVIQEFMRKGLELLQVYNPELKLVEIKRKENSKFFGYKSPL